MLDLNEYISEKLRISSKPTQHVKLNKDEIKTIIDNLKFQEDWPERNEYKDYLKLYPCNRYWESTGNEIFIKIADILEFQYKYELLPIFYTLMTGIYPDTKFVEIETYNEKTRHWIMFAVAAANENDWMWAPDLVKSDDFELKRK